MPRSADLVWQENRPIGLYSTSYSTSSVHVDISPELVGYDPIRLDTLLAE